MQSISVVSRAASRDVHFARPSCISLGAVCVPRPEIQVHVHNSKEALVPASAARSIESVPTFLRTGRVQLVGAGECYSEWGIASLLACSCVCSLKSGDSRQTPPMHKTHMMRRCLISMLSPQSLLSQIGRLHADSSPVRTSFLVLARQVE